MLPAGLRLTTTTVHGLGAAACLTIVAGAAFIGVFPTTRARAAERTEIARLEQVRADRVRVGEEYAALSQSLDAVRAENASRWVDLRGERQLNMRMADLTTMLTDRGFDIQALQAGDVEPGAVVSRIPIRLEVLGSLANGMNLLETLDRDYPDLHCDTINIEHTGPESIRLRLNMRWLLAPADMPKEKPAG